MRSVRLYLQDILEYIDRIEESMKKKNKDFFFKDALLQDSTARRLEVIGEAVKQISFFFKSRVSRYPLEKYCWNKRYFNPRLLCT